VTFIRNDNWPFSPKKLPFYYGWVILLSSTLGTIMSAPGQTIGVSVFTDYLIDALHVTRLNISVAYAVGTIGSSFIIGHVGRVIDRAGARIVATFASVGLGITLIGMSQIDKIGNWISKGITDQPFHSWIMLSCVTMGFLSMRFFGQGVLTLVSRTMLMSWFDRLRGSVNSVMGIFVTLIFSGAPLIFEVLINRFSWRGAWLTLGLATGGIFTLFILLTYRNSPRQCGLEMDGKKTSPESTPEARIPEKSFTVPQARKVLTFWMFNLGTALFSMLITAVSFHIVSIFEVAQKDRGEAISVFLPSSIIAVIINLTCGVLSDTPMFKYRLKYFLLINTTGIATMCTGVLLLEGSIGKYLIIGGMALASGTFGTVTAVVWPRYFGGKHLGALTGTNMSFLVFASAIGPALFGLSYNKTGQYNAAIIISLIVSGLIALLSVGANKPGSAPGDSD